MVKTLNQYQLIVQTQICPRIFYFAVGFCGRKVDIPQHKHEGFPEGRKRLLQPFNHVSFTSEGFCLLL